MKRSIIIALAAIVVAALAGGGFWYLRQLRPAAAAVPLPAPAVPVVAATVNGKDVPIYLRGIGTVIAYNTDVVRSQIQGQLVQITFTEGQAVKAGDLLAQIDPRPYQAQIEQLTANRDRVIWAIAASGRPQSRDIDDSNTPPFIPVKTNKPGAGPNGAEDRVVPAQKAPGRFEIPRFDRLPDSCAADQFAVDLHRFDLQGFKTEPIAQRGE